MCQTLADGVGQAYCLCMATATATPTLSTDILIIAEELGITFLAAGRVARIRACETSNEVVYASIAAERHWRRRSSTTLAELKEVATKATLAR